MTESRRSSTGIRNRLDAIIGEKADKLAEILQMMMAGKTMADSF
jgi:hypothetical protein